MADFRRWFTVLAVIAVMAFAASAQVGTISGSSAGGLACTATAGGTPEMRPEGFTELAGDIVIACTGGPTYQLGSNIPTTNIVVYMQPNVPITSRFLSTNGASEALLIIDEAGSALSTGATGNYGPKAPQLLCTSAQQQSSPNPCAAVVGLDGSGTYETSVMPGLTAGSYSATPAANVYQGKVGDFGNQTVTFYNVPVLPPATNGVQRVFRITNIRVPVAGTTLNYTLGAFLSTSPNQTLPLASTVINIGVVGPPMTAAVVPYKSNNPFSQCTAASVALTANLLFTEGFATGFKTRVVPGGASNGIPGNATGNITWAAEATNTNVTGNNQNIPGGLYGGFAANTESGFIFPQLTGTAGVSGGNYTAGLADYGTRLKAIFTNIPAGLTLYVSTTSQAQAIVPGGTSVLPYAVLVATNSGEATSDGTSFAPIAGTTTGSDGLPAIALSANGSGAAIAVWEVTNANPGAKDTLNFSVYVSYKATSSTTTNPYGLPITDLPLGSPVNNVSLSYAPEPGGGTFANVNGTQGQVPIPRFYITNTYQGRYVTINLCKTTLLYPYVIGISGYDTGIAVANTSMDPFGTVTQTGSCTLYGYGVTYGANNATTAATPVIPGCDSIANPLPGTNCFGGPITASNPNGYFIPPGTVGVVMASNVLANFQGYVIASCNFYYAHGYAALSDLGLRNLWSSYLALELSPVGIGTARGSGIETLAH
jgi:hypothetical protein